MFEVWHGCRFRPCLQEWVCVSVRVQRTFSTYLSYSFAQDIDGFYTKGEIARIIANNVRTNVPSSNRYMLG